MEENKNLQELIHLSDLKIEEKKREFQDMQNMSLNIVKEEAEGKEWGRREENRDINREEYLEKRQAALLKVGDVVEPNKYSFNSLTAEECRKLHQKLKQRKTIYGEEIKTTDTNDLNILYWQMYSDFINQASASQAHKLQISQDIAEIKSYISVLNQPCDLNTLHVYSKQPLSETELAEMERKYQQLKKRVKDKEIDNLNVEEVMLKAKKHFERQYGREQQIEKPIMAISKHSQ